MGTREAGFTTHSRSIHRLSALGVARLRRPGYYCDGGGLYLQVSLAGARSWVYRFRRAGRLREMGLGGLLRVSLADARERAQQCRRQLGCGLDPIEERRKEQARRTAQLARTKTFDECTTAYIRANRAGWKNEKHVAQWESTLATYASPIIGSLSVRDIDTTHIVSVLQPIWEAKPETASRVRGRVEAVLDWAKAHRYREDENPARWKGHLDKVLPARTKVRRVQHHAALPYTEAAAFMKALSAQEGLAARALELAILTAARTNEVIGAMRGEFDLDAGMWTVPAERMKAQRAHRIPLSGAALELVRRLLDNQDAELLFPGGKKGKPLSNMAMLTVLRRMKRTGLTVHGFRSTFRDWAAECTTYPNEMAEMALAHTVDDKVEAAYRRGDMFQRRRQMMEDWAIWCAGRASTQ
ncbi:tyrosine-type recombinase/integrase [Burkholderia multivorans]|uniref:tyrosine-type recombinase/integrase n=1 Tax=Burkholderia multivorans TaxID=87883 RepID=UPI001C26F980|nr:site-specific integrase [Burkholderia multivorans]MBU9597928.1 integrase arm-type DNA-binding domain-containing protein [Burkholderia multivorans]MDN8000946.1 integrase arm-type DNA-binding domain-containing protein [Burkholderia multivorans]WVN01625.1 integrase arm-type DNA-binding domain-containing protein [Burkholderia multivorans]